MTRKPRPQDVALRPALFAEEDVFHKPTVTLHPTVAELLEQYHQAGKVKEGDLARLLAAIKAHYELLGQVRPEHQSAHNAPVPVEIIAVIGEVFAGKEKWAKTENDARTNAAGLRDVQLRNIAEKLWRSYPKMSAKQIGERIKKMAEENARVRNIITIPSKMGRTRMMSADTIRRKIAKPKNSWQPRSALPANM